jgi:hypothetical protein
MSTAQRLISMNSLMTRSLRGSSSPRVREAMAWIDPERVSSLHGLLSAYHAKADTINRDAMLSEEGKREQLRSAASTTLGNVAGLAKKIAEVEAKHHEERASAVPLPKADAAEVLLDLALVAHVKHAQPIPSALERMSPRIRLAVARTPPELAGIPPDVQARVHGSLIDPERAVQLGEEAQALGAARNSAQAALDELAPIAGWEPRALVQHFGARAGWKLPGVVQTLADRLESSAEA